MFTSKDSHYNKYGLLGVSPIYHPQNLQFPFQLIMPLKAMWALPELHKLQLGCCTTSYSLPPGLLKM